MRLSKHQNSHSRGQVYRVRKEVEKLLRDTESIAVLKYQDSIMSAYISELSVSVIIKQKLNVCRRHDESDSARKLISVILINPHHKETGIIMTTLQIRKLRIRKIMKFTQSYDEMATIGKQIIISTCCVPGLFWALEAQWQTKQSTYLNVYGKERYE